MKRFIFIGIFSLIFQACSLSQTNLILEAELKQVGNNIQVLGKTNLPDKAQILVSLLDIDSKSAHQNNIVSQAFADVKNLNFEATLKLDPPPKSGKYYVRLRFSPDAYDWSGGKVLEFVGPKGEKMHGPYVLQDGDIRFLQNELPIDYQARSVSTK